MLDSKGLEQLYQVLNAPDDTLQNIQSAFLSFFNDSLSVFKASYALSNLINLNLLTCRQRIIAIFLLIQNFKYEGIKRHPFGATILNISNITTEAFQRKMIAQMIVDMKRDKYSKVTIQSLFQEEQCMIDPIQQRPELKKIREQFIANLPKVSQSKKSAVKNIVPDFNVKDKKTYPPDYQPNFGTIKQTELSNESFNVGFLRPLPRFIEIHPSQLNWLSPGIITDVHWDNSAQIDKKLSKAKSLIKKAVDQHLSKQECSQIQRALQIEPYAVLNLGITPELLSAIIKNNSYIAVVYLAKLANYPIIGDYLQSFLEYPISINSMDVISRLHKIVRIPHEFTTTYALYLMRQIRQRPQTDKDRNKLAKLGVQFLKSFSKNNILNLKNYEQDVQDFINSCLQVEQVQNLKKLLQKE